MALVDEVQNRYGTQYLVNLTNPQLPSATSIDSTRLSNASTDVQADFKIIAGVTYDNSVDTHVSVAVDGVIAKLRMRNGQGGSESVEAHNQYIERLRQLAKITGRNRVEPKSSSSMTETTETQQGETTRPKFDRRRFDDITLNKPPASE